MLVEPYFRIDQLRDVAGFDNIERVLLGSGVKKPDREVLAAGLAVLPQERALEVRIASALHDRYLIPRDEGKVRMLGMSLAGIGKKVSTITTLGELAPNALRAAHEELWNNASALAPRPRRRLRVHHSDRGSFRRGVAQPPLDAGGQVVSVDAPAPPDVSAASRRSVRIAADSATNHRAV